MSDTKQPINVRRLAKMIENQAVHHVEDIPEGAELLDGAPEVQASFVLDAIAYIQQHKPGLASNRFESSIATLLRRKLPFMHDDIVALLRWLPTQPRYLYQGTSVIKATERHLKDNALTPELHEAIDALIEHLRPKDDWKEGQRDVTKLLALLGEDSSVMPLLRSDAWADAALDEYEAMDADAQGRWRDLLQLCGSATAGTPSTKWLKDARQAVDAVGFDGFKAAVLRWFPLADEPHTEIPANMPQHHNREPLLMLDVNMDVLKGLVWMSAFHEDQQIARALAALAVSTYRKIDIHGVRAPRVGNATVWALGAMPGRVGLAQLAVIKVKVRYGGAQQAIDKAMTRAAERLELDPAEIEELIVPTYDLDDVGVRRVDFDTATAELRVEGTTDVVIAWQRADGKAVKSVPRDVKTEHADEVAALTQTANDIKKMLPAQRDRIEALYLERIEWTFATWRERYLDHPLVGTLARRLIWRFGQGKQTTSGIWHDGELIGLDQKPIAWLDDQTTVTLWHPLDEPTETVQGWRAWLVAHEVQQPFKQAHREVYVVTDAERTTRVYSNRFAAHILRQHQFNALASARRWRNQLRLMVDDTYAPAERRLAAWNMRAEFWIEGAGNDYGTDTTDTGTYLYVTTDQVRFYPIDAPQHTAHASGGGYRLYLRDGEAAVDPIPQADVPALVFSEIMRDVDLFVGVASVGNDPTWADGGLERPYRQYWASYAFGELAEAAKVRREILGDLLPRLKIADRSRLADRFLEVRGDLHTYKIHLGSGNILMEPGDRYLCIVPSRGKATGTDQLFLPFEGDTMLAIILSKAMMLANDTAIKDPTILTQIQ